MESIGARWVRGLAAAGELLFVLAVVGIGLVTITSANGPPDVANPHVIAVIPWLPMVPQLAVGAGIIWLPCGLGLIAERTEQSATLVFAVLFLASAIVVDGPTHQSWFVSGLLRTRFFEPVALASLACLLPAQRHSAVRIAARYVFAACLVSFGITHFRNPAGIASIVPHWIPWPAVDLSGILFVVAGLCVAFDVGRRCASFALAFMFATWILTLHIPDTFNWYGRAHGTPLNPNLWSSLLIAVAMCGGACVLADATAS